MVRSPFPFVAWLLTLCLAATAGSAAPPEPPLRVITFNVRLPLAQDGPNAWEHRRDLAVRMLRSERPDIIATQELHKVQGDFLLERLRGYSWFGMGRRGDHSDEHMGIFYRRDRMRIVALGNFWLSDTPTIPASISWGNLYPRMVTWGLFETKSGRRFYVANTHFPYRPEDAAARYKAAAQILAWIDSLPPDVPVILAGDFNASPDSPEHRLLTARLADAWASASSRHGPEGTFHNFTGTPDRRIDWILLRGFRAESARTVTTNAKGRYPSDHFPVVAELRWNAGGAGQPETAAETSR